jgi:hypothetical protein
MWAIEFSSDKFRPFLPEDAQVNPGAYGFELAAWLSRALAEKGVLTSYPISEDWGWFISYDLSSKSALMIACGSMSDPGEGAGGQLITWHISLQHRKKASPQELEGVRLVSEAIAAVLSAESIAFRQNESR